MSSGGQANLWSVYTQLMELPTFKYHPDPIRTGSIKSADVECKCCGQSRGFIYAGPVYAITELRDSICPWCIADRSAHEKFDASFVDDMGVGGYGHWDAVPGEIVAEVAWCTPGFSGWQQEEWWTHCGDAAAFLGIAGYAELHQHGQEAFDFIRAVFSEQTNITGEKLDEWMKSFGRESGPTAYVFQCLHCQKLGGYWDSL